VLSIVDYGVFVRLRDGVEALCSTQDVQEPEGSKLKPGDKVKVEISSLDTIDRRLFVTMKNIGVEKPAPAERPKKAKGGTTAKAEEGEEKPIAGTIGDLIREKLGAKIGELKKE